MEWFLAPYFLPEGCVEILHPSSALVVQQLLVDGREFGIFATVGINKWLASPQKMEGRVAMLAKRARADMEIALTA